jgi:Fic family protein
MDIKKTPAGSVVKTLNGYFTFIPNPLPPQIIWDNALINNLSQADYILGMLAREGAKLPNPHLLIRPFIAREAVLSSKIEGTQTTLSELLAHEAGVHVDRNPQDLQETQNYIDALEYGIRRLNELPLSLRLIKEIHGKLMQEVRGGYATPGEFRISQNWIGAPGSSPTTAKFIPPSPDRLMETLGEFETFLYDRTLPPLIHVALCHYQFEAIHPFLDGNGRVGRLLIILLLLERKILPSPILYISAFFEATRDEYYQQLYNVSAYGTWSAWLNYFLNGVALQSQDALSRAERINNLIVEWKIAAGGSSQVLQDIITQLAINPFLTVTKVAQQLDVAFTTAQRAIKKLEQLEIISNVSHTRRDRTYCATKILAILEEPAKINQDVATGY